MRPGVKETSLYQTRCGSPPRPPLMALARLTRMCMGRSVWAVVELEPWPSIPSAVVNRD